MSVSSIATFGSAAIASPPANDANVKRDDKPADAPRSSHRSGKAPGTGQFVDKKV